MNTHDIELPPLPKPAMKEGDTALYAAFAGSQLTDYALAAIEPYQQRIEELESQLEAIGAGGVSSQRITSPSRGEPVARVNADGFIVETGLGLAPGTLLYTAPQPAEPEKEPPCET